MIIVGAVVAQDTYVDRLLAALGAGTPDERCRSPRHAKAELSALGENGYLHLVDRVKNMIIVDADATNVYPYLLDEFLVSLPGIRTAATIGVLDEDRVEHLETFIVPELSFDIVPLPDLILAEFDASYLPRMIHLIDAMPMTHLGQPDQYALRALAESGPH